MPYLYLRISIFGGDDSRSTRYFHSIFIFVIANAVFPAPRPFGRLESKRAMRSDRVTVNPMNWTCRSSRSGCLAYTLMITHWPSNPRTYHCCNQRLRRPWDCDGCTSANAPITSWNGTMHLTIRPGGTDGLDQGRSGQSDPMNLSSASVAARIASA